MKISLNLTCVTTIPYKTKLETYDMPQITGYGIWFKAYLVEMNALYNKKWLRNKTIEYLRVKEKIFNKIK